MSNDFGNVFTEGFSAVWNNEKYTISRRLIAHPEDNHIKCDTICSRCPVTFTFETSDKNDLCQKGSAAGETPK